jgi:hypothetical protein
VTLPVGRRDCSEGRGALCNKFGSFGPKGSKVVIDSGAGVLRMGGCAWSVRGSVRRDLRFGTSCDDCAALESLWRKALAIVSTDETRVLRGGAPVLLLLVSTFVDGLYHLGYDNRR